MKLIVGLGNPGKKYENTRHNTGFLVIDSILKKLNLELDTEKFKALYTIYNHNGEKVIIVKPLTFMNLSGEAVIQIMNYYDISVDDLIIIHDDLDLPVGKVRLRKGGSSGGQKGIGNIIELLKTSDIKRIRVGIDKDPMIPVIDYVLGKIKKEDKEVYKDSIERAADAAIYALDHNFDVTMSNFNK